MPKPISKKNRLNSVDTLGHSLTPVSAPNADDDAPFDEHEYSDDMDRLLENIRGVVATTGAACHTSFLDEERLRRALMVAEDLLDEANDMFERWLQKSYHPRAAAEREAAAQERASKTPEPLVDADARQRLQRLLDTDAKREERQNTAVELNKPHTPQMQGRLRAKLARLDSEIAALSGK